MAVGWNGADPTEVSDGSDYELGTEYLVNQDITITHVRVWSSAGALTFSGRKGRIWTTAGVQSGIATMPDTLSNGWTTHALDAPVGKAAGTSFLVTYNTGGNYGVTAAALAAAGVTSADGAVTAKATGSATNGNGVFNTTPNSFPTNTPGSGPFYGIDIVYTLGLPGDNPPTISSASVTAVGATATASIVATDPETLVGATYGYDWGDGTTTSTTHPDNNDQHTYAASGIYPVLLSVTDADGNAAHVARYVQVFIADSSVNTLPAKAIQQALASHAMSLGQFDSLVGMHEPRMRPTSDLHAALWLNGVTPIRTSGLNVVSVRMELLFRLYAPGEQEPQDDMDAVLLTAADRFMASLCGDFDLDDHVASGLVRMIDIFGAYGQGLTAAAGWARWSDGMSRVVTITIPVICNDVWSEA